MLVDYWLQVTEANTYCACWLLTTSDWSHCLLCLLIIDCMWLKPIIIVPVDYWLQVTEADTYCACWLLTTSDWSHCLLCLLIIDCMWLKPILIVLVNYWLHLIEATVYCACWLLTACIEANAHCACWLLTTCDWSHCLLCLLIIDYRWLKPIVIVLVDYWLQVIEANAYSMD